MNLSSGGSMVPGSLYTVVDLQGQMHTHQQQNPHGNLQKQQQQQQQQHLHQPSHHYEHPGQMVCSGIGDVYPLSGSQLQEHNQQTLAPVIEYNKVDRMKVSTSEEDEHGFNAEDGIDSHQEFNKIKKNSPWQRVKWTDSMVKLLITAVSYIGDDSSSECNRGRRKFSILQKKGKWKSISKVMAERGCHVSPQQCEDKFNDLNKRYKRLYDVLGRGTSCQVVENPALLDRMDNLSEKSKEDVRKILSSKHLFYEEMCSYHNGNRLNLPADPALQKSLQVALGCKDDHDTRKTSHDDLDEDDRGADSDDMENESGNTHGLHDDIIGGPCLPPKRLKRASDIQYSNGNTFSSLDCNARPITQAVSIDKIVPFPEGTEPDLQKQWLMSRKIQLEEQSLNIQIQMLELEKQRFKWQRFSRKKERELEKVRLENEGMKLENDRLGLELKQKEIELGLR